MFCGNCGTENTEDVENCKNCGKPLGKTVNNKNVQEVEQKNIGEKKINSGTKELIEKIKLIPRKVLIACACGAVAIIVIVCFAINASSTIDLNKYVTVETTGYNGYGYADVVVDWEAIESKYKSKVSFTSKFKNEYGGLLSLTTPVDALAESVSVSLSSNDKLSNGDEIEYTWNIEDDISQYVKCKLKYKDSTYKISELQEVDSFDAFAELKVSFEGVTPNGSVVYDYTGSDLSTRDFYCDSTNGLRNGDTVKIYMDENNIEDYAENMGKIPSKLELEYTVEGLDEYVESFSDLNEEFMSKVKSEAEDSIYAYVANSYHSSSSMSDLTYAGYIMNKATDESKYVDTYNNLYIIYSGTVSNTDNEFPTTTVHYPVKFTNLIKSGNDITFGENCGIVGASDLREYWYSTKGYTSPLNCYMEIVETNKDSYNSESGDGFEKYGEYELVSKLDSITDAYKEEIYADTQTLIETYMKKNYSYEFVVTDVTYVGEYLLNAKDNNVSIKDRNSYIIVFSATVSDKFGELEATTVYFPVVYSGLVKLPGDEYVISFNQGIQGYSSLPNSYYSIEGYVDGEEMYNSLITEKRENYTYDISDGLKQFGN